MKSKIETCVRLMRWPLVKAGWILCCTYVIGHGGLRKRSCQWAGGLGETLDRQGQERDEEWPESVPCLTGGGGGEEGKQERRNGHHVCCV